MVKITPENIFLDFRNRTHPYTVHEIVNTLVKLEEDGTLCAADLHSIASRLKTAANEIHRVGYQFDIIATPFMSNYNSSSSGSASAGFFFVFFAVFLLFL